MNNLIRCELNKFKSSNIKYSIFVFFIPVFLMVSMYMFNAKYPIVEWDIYLTNIQTFLNMMVCIIVFGIITAYMFGSEFETKTINVLFTYPFNKTKILFSKLIVIFIIIITTLMITFLLSLLCGLLIKHEVLTFNIILSHFIDYLQISLMQFMLISIVAVVTIYSKHILPAIIFIVSVTFLNFILMNTTISIIFPWSIPLILTPHSFGGRTYINYYLGYTTICIYFLIGLFLSIKKFKYIQ